MEDRLGIRDRIIGVTVRAVEDTIRAVNVLKGQIMLSFLYQSTIGGKYMIKSTRMKLISIVFVVVVTVAATITVPLNDHVAVAEAATIKINKSKVTMEIATTTALEVTGTKSKVTWKTSNKKVASVNSKGVVTAHSAGIAKITATVGKKRYTCTVTVIDYDHAQLLTFVEGLNAHINMAGQLAEYQNQYIAGKITVDDLINGYQQLSDDSQYLLGLLQGAEWNTDTYYDQVSLLTEVLESLVQGEALSYEAIVNNDADKLIEAETYLETYDIKLDEFLTAMGV